MIKGKYSPPDGQYPQDLPDYWKSEDGTIYTNLQNLTNTELNSIGWLGPIEMPPFPGTTNYTHSFIWNTETRSFDVIELSTEEIHKRINYQYFWDEFIITSAYSKIRETAKQSLVVNTVATEFIALLSDAKNNKANQQKIQEIILEIFENILFTEEELIEIESIFKKTGMGSIYSLKSVN